MIDLKPTTEMASNAARGLELREILPAIPRHLPAAGAFQVHDAAHARVHRGDVECAAGFQKHGESRVSQALHQRQAVRLEERFPAGEFHERQSLTADR